MFNQVFFKSMLTLLATVVMVPSLAQDTVDLPGAKEVHTAKKPKFPGGKKALLKYLTNETNYPDKANKNDVEGEVKVKFIINKKGEPVNVKILKGVSKALNQEALRVIRNMPKWEPGTQDGERVRVSYVLPINFSE